MKTVLLGIMKIFPFKKPPVFADATTWLAFDWDEKNFCLRQYSVTKKYRFNVLNSVIESCTVLSNSITVISKRRYDAHISLSPLKQAICILLKPSKFNQ